jgi:hypothetical protein
MKPSGRVCIYCANVGGASERLVFMNIKAETFEEYKRIIYLSSGCIGPSSNHSSFPGWKNL